MDNFSILSNTSLSLHAEAFLSSLTGDSTFGLGNTKGLHAVPQSWKLFDLQTTPANIQKHPTTIADNLAIQLKEPLPKTSTVGRVPVIGFTTTKDAFYFNNLSVYKATFP